VVANKVGGQTMAAFDGERMIGFLLAIPGVKGNGKPYLHSHMMGVIAEYRDQGVGRMLKLAQREQALARGIEIVEWTFDPLEIKNAYFNIEKLGAVVKRFVPNQYGTTSSHLHGGLPTDRCVPEWHVGSERVKTILAGEGWKRGETMARVEVPNHIGELRKTNQAAARTVLSAVSEGFQANFAQGLTVTGFKRGETHGAYLFTREEE
jgi:predicted GNAT superfamily acetyltransferase